VCSTEGVHNIQEAKNLLFLRLYLRELKMFITIIKFLSNALKIVGMGFFVYSAYEGTFTASGNSTTVFIGVAVLTVIIVITHIIDDIRR
jgi:hypothetical protein